MGCGGSKPAEGGNASANKSQGGKKQAKEMPRKEIKEGGIGKQMFISENNGKITDVYELDKKKLGEGSYGTVCKATHKKLNCQRACKSISKAQMKNDERFKQEIQIMKLMDHPNIVKLHECFEDHRNIYLVMELCTGGELFDRIIDAGHFTETQAAIVMKQIIQAIFYMHESHVCHRDLKPENFLFSTKDSIEKTHLKIIDFGLSCSFKEGQVLTTKAGTPYYVAPQVLAGKYDQASDLWSCGVITYVLLCGYPPFYGETDADVLSKVRLGNFSFNAADWKNITEDAKNLIRMLLKMNPRDRYSAEQALNHAWISEKAPKATGIDLQQGFVDNLRGFRGQNKLKKAALQCIAGQLDDSNIKQLRETFMALDSNGDGLLTLNEMKEGLQKAGLKDIPADLKQIMEDVDSDGSGVVDYTEFLAASLDRALYLQEHIVWQAFAVFDTNNDGVISKEELKQVLCNGDVSEVGSAGMIAELLKDCDSNGDGMIDFQEFMAMMRKQGNEIPP